MRSDVQLLLLLQCCTSDSALRQVLTCTPTPLCRCDPCGQKKVQIPTQMGSKDVKGTWESAGTRTLAISMLYLVASCCESELQVPSASKGYRCWGDLPGGRTTQKCCFGVFGMISWEFLGHDANYARTAGQCPLPLIPKTYPPPIS